MQGREEALVDDFKVLVIGGGLVGLALAQGLRKIGLSCTVFEQLPPDTSQTQGWGLSLSFGVDHLLSLLPSHLVERFKSTQTNPDQNGADHYTFKHFNAATANAAYDLSGEFGRMRVHRDKLWRLLSEDIDIHWNKKFERISFQDKEVVAGFADGSSYSGSLVIGADGSGSLVRKAICPENWKPYVLSATGTGVSVKYPVDKLKPVLALDPLLFEASHPISNSFMFFSTMDSQSTSKDGTYKVQVFISWPILDEERDAVPATDSERLENMRRRTQDWAEPLRGLVHDIPEGTPVKAVRLADWVPQEWDNHGGRITLAGDAAHTMTMYRGEAVNHGFLDAANLVKALEVFKRGDLSLEQAIYQYESSMKARNRNAVMLSRQACIDAHNWPAISKDSPLIDRSVKWMLEPSFSELKT